MKESASKQKHTTWGNKGNVMPYVKEHTEVKGRPSKKAKVIGKEDEVKGLTAAQKKLPKKLQNAIMKKKKKR